MKQKLLISVGLIVCLVMAFALPMCAPAPPVEEETPPPEEEVADFVTAVGSTTPDVLQKIAELATEKTGIVLRWRYNSCGELRAKFLAEAPRFGADIAVVVCGPETFMMQEGGYMESYDSPVVRARTREWGAIPIEAVVDPKNEWIHSDTWHFVVITNDELIAETGYARPESWEDFLDPKWKGEIVMPSPLTSGTAFMMLFSFMTEYGFNKDKGEEGGWEFWGKLDENIHHYTRSGNAPTDLVARGEFMAAITADENVKLRLDEGYPITWSVPKEGTGFDSHYTFILKGTKRLAAAKKMMDFLASDDYAKLMSDIGYPTGLAGYFGKYGDAPPPFISNIDPKWAIANKSRLCEEWKDRFLRV